MLPKQSYDELKLEIARQQERLSKRLWQIAEFALRDPDSMALKTVAGLAACAQVQPSTLIRFAKHFGYSGFSEMQSVFRTRLIDRSTSYAQRIREFSSIDGGATEPADILRHFVEYDIAALRHLSRETSGYDLDRAVDLLAAADVIGVVAKRRSFPIAGYLAYALSHLGRRALLIHGLGGMDAEQMRLVSERDLLVAVSFKPYAPETLAVVASAAERGVPVLAVTDGPFSPLVPLAKVSFEVEEAQVQGIRSLTASMCLAASLVIALGQRLERRSSASGLRARRSKGNGAAAAIARNQVPATRRASGSKRR